MLQGPPRVTGGCLQPQLTTQSLLQPQRQATCLTEPGIELELRNTKALEDHGATTPPSRTPGKAEVLRRSPRTLHAVPGAGCCSSCLATRRLSHVTNTHERNKKKSWTRHRGRRERTDRGETSEDAGGRSQRYSGSTGGSSTPL